MNGKEVYARSSKSLVGVNLKEKAFIFVNDSILARIKRNQALSLSEEGDRWEGDVLDDKPYGWGVLYDQNTHMVYEGFRIGDSSTL